MCRKYGPAFSEDGIGSIQVFDRFSFPFCSHDGLYLLEDYSGELYEPGTCAHMIENYSDRPICFVDIGAHFGFGSCLAEPLWMRHKAKHGKEKQLE